MKSLKYIIFSSLFVIGTAFSMGQAQYAPELPKDIWIAIAKYGFNKDGKTEQEMFEFMDKTRQINKAARSAMDENIKRIAEKMYGVELSENPAYTDTKSFIIDMIILERAGIVRARWGWNLIKLMFNPNMKFDYHISKSEMDGYMRKFLSAAINLRAVNWFQTHLEGRKLQGPLKNMLSKIVIQNLGMTSDLTNVYHDISPKFLEFLLSIGINPNKATVMISGEIVMHGGEISPTVEGRKGGALHHLLMKIEYMLLAMERHYDPQSQDYYNRMSRNFDTFEDIIKLNKYKLKEFDDIIQKIKILLKYGADIKQPFFESEKPIGGQRYKSPLEFAKYLLDKYQKDVLSKKESKINYYMGKTSDPVALKLQEIVKILEEEEKKPYYGTL